MFDLGRWALVIVVASALVGYAAGFFAQRKIDRGIVPVLLLLLAHGLYVILFRAEGYVSHISEVNWIAAWTFAISICAAASASWVFTRRHVVALPISIVLAMAAAYGWIQIWAEHYCNVTNCFI
jgi:hypothetical protein